MQDSFHLEVKQNSKHDSKKTKMTIAAMPTELSYPLKLQANPGRARLRQPGDFRRTTAGAGFRNFPRYVGVMKTAPDRKLPRVVRKFLKNAGRKGHGS